MKDKEQDIRQIAELAGCTYPECILKIRYLKQIKKIPEDYFVDEVNGLVNRCSKEDQELLKKLQVLCIKLCKRLCVKSLFLDNIVFEFFSYSS